MKEIPRERDERASDRLRAGIASDLVAQLAVANVVPRAHRLDTSPSTPPERLPIMVRRSTTPTPSMNAASDKDPFNNNCYGTLVDRAYKLGQPAGARRRRLQRAHHPRLRGGLRREGPARRPVAGPLARPGRHRVAARLQLHRPGDPRVHPGELHRLHGLRDRVPGHRHPRQGARRGRVGGRSSRTIPEADREMYKAQWSKTKKYYDAGEEEGTASAGCSTSSSTRRSARAAPSASPSATTTR